MIDPLGAETGPAYQTLGHVDALPAGTRLGEFEIQGLLGFGGFGMVYRGYDHSLERPVAIKEYMPAALVARSANHALSARSSSDDQTFQAGLNSFIAEARLLARFDHPSLVKVYRFWEANNTAYMAMPLYQGITLKQARLQMSGPPPEEWLRVVLWSVLEALKVLHSSDAMHRDVSPDNIFLQDQGPPVLLDLGAARLAVIEGNKKHTAVLKVNYAPIEQYADVSDMREGPWTDIYAVAAVIHGCICNEPPLPATFRVVRDRLPSMAKIAKTTETHFGQSYSSSFIKAIDLALSVQPGDRPASVEAFAKVLKLRSVSQLQRFDWIAALGDKVSLSGVGAAAGSVAFGASATVDETIPFAKAAAIAGAKPARVDAATAIVQTPQVAWLRWWWLGALGVATAMAVAIAWIGRGTTAPSAVSNVAVAAPPLVPVSAAEAVPSPVQSLSVEEVFIPASGAAAVAPLPASPASDKSAGTVARVPSRQVGTARPAGASTTKPIDDSRSATVKASPEIASAVPAKADARDAQQAPEVAKPRQDAQSLCPDSNVFTRPMCVYRECQKPEHRKLQVCIEDRERWEERDRLNRP